MTIEPTRALGTQTTTALPTKPANSAAIPEPVSTEPKDEFDAVVRVKVYPQDPLVGGTEVLELPKELLGDRLSAPRLSTRDRAPVAIADPDGNYDFDLTSPQFDQANAHAIVANTLRMYDDYLGAEARFSFRGPLKVIPHKGEGKTAYFSRWDQSINFFEWDSPSLGKRVTTAQSADVIAHEIGHAVWDGLRPLAGYSNEAGAFHEAFGDCTALLHSLQIDSNISKALAENGGDLRKPSLISRMAEEFGTGFNKEDKDPKNDNNAYYRTALNEFKYIDPKDLPDDDYPPTVGEDVLTREFHSFSRVWSGAFYRMLTALYDGQRSEGKEGPEALAAARDKLGSLWGQGLQELPPAGIKFKVVAESMLKVAARGGDLVSFDRLADVMVDRNILTKEQAAKLRTPAASEVSSGDGRPETVLTNLSEQFELPEGYLAEGEPRALRDGRTVYLFTKPERVALPGLTHHGEQIEMDLRSGVAATFDQSGKLVSYYHTPVGQEERQDAERFATDLMNKDRVKVSAFDIRSENDSGQIFLGRLVPDGKGVQVFERVPVFD